MTYDLTYLKILGYLFFKNLWAGRENDALVDCDKIEFPVNFDCHVNSVNFCPSIQITSTRNLQQISPYSALSSFFVDSGIDSPEANMDFKFQAKTLL